MDNEKGTLATIPGETAKSDVNRAVTEVPTGILRLDPGKPTRLFVDFKFDQKENVSPQPSVDRLSVTFAENPLKPENLKFSLNQEINRMQQLQQQQSQQYQQDKVLFPEEQIDNEESEEEDYSASVNAIFQRRASTRRSKKQSRRASSPFTAETPGPERRRSSVFTTSSGDTAITVDDNPNNDVTQDEIFENIKLHKEVLSNVKMQPWNMRKKLKLVLQAKAYIKKHEGQLQERLAQSHSTKDMLARWNIVLIKVLISSSTLNTPIPNLYNFIKTSGFVFLSAGAYVDFPYLNLMACIRQASGECIGKLVTCYFTIFIQKWQKWKREITNMSMWFIPWELKIKEIESHFGSVVASYFIFLRWLFWVNIVIAVVIISFVTIPEIFTADPQAIKDRKFILPEENYNSTNFLTLWDFEGVFKYSPLFYGWYTNKDYNDSAALNSYDGKNPTGHGYRLPFAYFVTGLVVYAYSFFATLRKMAENSRMSKLSEKDDECIFSWKVFTAWDYMIGNAETAHNRVASIVMGFKEALLEEAEKKRESRNWKVICLRVIVNTLVAGLLSCSVVAVVVVVKRSTEPDANSTIWRRNEITVVITLITLFFPMLFEVLGFVEQYHPRKQLRLQLARIMVLNLLNLYSLIIALFDKIEDMTILLKEFKANLTKVPSTDFYFTTPMNFDSSTRSYDETTVQCFCNDSLITNQNAVISLDMISYIAQNLSVLALPKFNELANIFNNANLTSDNGEGFNYVEVNSTYSPDNFTYYYENSSLNWNDNTTNYPNYSFSNISNNLTDFNTTFFMEDIRDLFVDYLTYILSPFVYLNSSDLNFNISLNGSFNESIEINNNTLIPLNLSTMGYEYFKSTMLPLFNTTSLHDEEEERFEIELSSVFENISSTISSWPDLISTLNYSLTTPEYEESTNSTDYFYCLNYCKSSFESQSSNVLANNITSTSIATVSYGEIEYRKILNYTLHAKLRSLCWETMFGQELLKLTILDLIMSGLSILFMDFIRGIFVRVMNRCWCWDLEKKFPQYGDFKVAENILHLVNNQGMVWMGMFFSPGLVLINVFKLYIMMYLRAWAVLTCNVPHEIIFRASRSNNFYYALLLMMLFLCVLPVGYAIVWIEPSWHCGPFSGYNRIFHIFTKTIRANVPESMHRALDYIASPGIVIPLLLLLILFIYYLVSLTGALREANNDLKTQLRRERTEERRKMFQLADRRRRTGSGESNDQTPFSKWKKLIGNLPSARSCDEPRQESEDFATSQKEEEEEEKVENRGRVFFSKLIKKALGKSSSSEEEQEGTDTDQHDSLPYDHKDPEKKSIKTSQSGGSLELNALQSIVSRWSLRRSSHKEDQNSNEPNKNLNNKLHNNEDLSERTQETKRKETIENNSKSKNEKPKAKEGSGNISDNGNFNKQVKTSKADIHKSHTVRSSPKPNSHERSDLSSDISKEKSVKPKKSTSFRDHQERSITNNQRLSQISKTTEGNSFLKRVMEAKQSGVFDKDEYTNTQREPKPSTSKDNNHSKIKNKDRTKIAKSRPRRPITEIQEESIEDKQPHSFINSGAKDHEVVTKGKLNKRCKKIVARQDSSSSVWSDNIPVITISKTFSHENILDGEEQNRSLTENKKDRSESQNVKNKSETPQGTNMRRKFVFKENYDYSDDEESGNKFDCNNKTHFTKQSNNEHKPSNQEKSFKPKIRCVLKKQETAIDEDVIIHFGAELEKAKAESQLFMFLKNEKMENIEGSVKEKTSPISPKPDSRHIVNLASSLEPRTTNSEECTTPDRSTSDDTTEVKDDSVKTVLNSPYYISKCDENSDNKTVDSQNNDSIDSQTELDFDTDINNSIEYETDSIPEQNRESLEEDSSKDYLERDVRTVSRLQRPSMKSSSRSQTESSSYYQE